MDGLPKNKKPWSKEHQRQQIALDDYLFERKLQEVYDKKTASNDLPVLFKKITKKFRATKIQAKKKLIRKHVPVIAKKSKTKPAATLIDAPYIAPKKFAKQTTATKPQKAKHFAKVSKNKRTIVSFAAPALVLALVAVVIISRNHSPKKDTPTVAGAVSAQKPDFDTLLPSTITDESKIKFDPTKKVASFQDVIEGGRIVVNQQKLGETQLKDTEFLRRTALGFNLTTEVTTKKGQAFIGENRETNTQFAFFVYKDFLFLIQSDKTYKYQTVVEYIDALQ